MTVLPATARSAGPQPPPAPLELPLELRPPPGFSAQVRQCFARRAPGYDQQALLQRAVAWRLAGLARDLPLPPGPCADLGAGSGLLSRALLQRCPDLRDRPPLQLDLCPELLARNPIAAASPGGPLPPSDLNDPLPPRLAGAALFVSSFALQWLERPAASLGHWCEQLAPGGWLLLALPVAGSFDAWHQAAAAAAVPFTGLPLPPAQELIAAAAPWLELRPPQRLRFSRHGCDGLDTLRLLAGLGATASRQPPLNAGQLRRLLRHWPSGASLRWEVLLLLGRRR
jgi:malonyl-CoA O-methyltransferase